MSTGKVTKAEFDRSYDSKFGTQYVYKVEIDGNLEAEFTSTKNPQNAFVVGETVEYNIEDKTGTKKNGDTFTYKKITKVKESQFQGGGKGLSPEARERIKKSVFLNFCDTYDLNCQVIGVKDHPVKNDIWKLLSELYNTLATEPDMQVTFHGVVNHVIDMYYKFPQVYKLDTLDEIRNKITSNFNLVAGIKK